LRKAFSALVSRGTLHRIGARYRVAGSRGTFATIDIVFFIEKDIENERTQNLQSASEQIASKSGVALFRDQFTHTEPLLTSERKKLLARKALAGYIIDFWGYTTGERSRYFLDLVSLLYNSRKPVAIIDQVGSLELPEPFRSSRRIHTFSIAGYLAGAEVGRFILSLGHQRAAFITSSSGEFWSQQRFEGVLRAFGEASLPPQAVTVYKVELAHSADTVICTTLSLSDTEINTLYSNSMSKDAMDQLKAQRERGTGRLPLQPREIENTREVVQSILSLYASSLDKNLADSIRVRIFEHLAHNVHQQFLQPVFDQVCKDASVTAWICDSDAIGRAAVSYLRTRPGATGSGRISVVSFDNSRFAAEENLTSYDFDIAGVFQQAVSFVAGRHQTQSNKQRTECRGVLCIRKSSGKRMQ
jgi:DNA-binding LacI/PurR family transcriptional regulator